MGGKSSNSFDLLHPKVQRWVWRQGWSELHAVQEEAIQAILLSDDDLILSAATAGGKTEAAFLPICSRLVDQASEGIDVLCVSPLKALINDQFSRVEELCETLEIPVHRWHGDVSQGRKKLVLKNPSGILIITPESLEALFVIHGGEIASLFQGLRHIVVDELHSFIGGVRGRHLQSLLSRVELSLGHRVPRVGLSATLGDMRLAAEFLRPGSGEKVKRIVSDDEGQEIKLQIRGYQITAPPPPPPRSPDEAELPPSEEEGGDLPDICGHLFKTLRGTDNLVFANRRRDVELCADILRRLSDERHVPNEFWPHHGSLSAEIREEAESRLKDKSLPATVVCTNTLELGIDVGNVKSVAQIGAPPSVASMRQRMGRSGRRGDPAILRIYIREPEITPSSSVADRLRLDLVKSIAMVRLLLGRWCEPPAAETLHLSTMIQQVLSIIAERSGATAVTAWRILCERGPFRGVDRPMFVDTLRAMATVDLIVQASDQTLLLGGLGERIVNHYSFYAVFQTPEEYRLVSGARALGTLPITFPVAPGSYLLFGGLRWEVLTVDDRRKVIELQRTSAGKAPLFGGDAALVHGRVREEMFRVYTASDAPPFLDGPAARLLTEGREEFRRLGLDREHGVQAGQDTLLFCWTGDRAINTLLLQLRCIGFKAEKFQLILRIEKALVEEVRQRLAEVALDGPSDARTLALLSGTKIEEKYDRYLSDDLLAADYASRALDINAGWDLACAIAGRTVPARNPRQRLES
ncbi:MAG: DEAD/DEAH box helicase [Deltaproteobacteria bacterium]|nr:DEAD/DEAH box helicase [Deltaproteobacteria bacterium]